MELALRCDLRLCSDRSQLAQPEVLAGVMAGFGATERLPRIVGPARALELLLLCEAVDPATAAAIGLVNRVLPTEGFEDAVQVLAERLARRPAAAVAATKRAVRTGDEVREMLAVWRSPEARSGLERVSLMVREELERPEPRPLPELLAAMER